MHSIVLRMVWIAVLICVIALAAVTPGDSLIWALNTLGTLMYWMIASAICIAAIFCVATLLLILGFWLWPGELEIAHIADDEAA